jgi:hypothetical protein
MKKVNVKGPNRINLANGPVRVKDILFKKVFGQGKVKTQGTGKATQGTKHNADWSGKL